MQEMAFHQLSPAQMPVRYAIAVIFNMSPQSDVHSIYIPTTSGSGESPDPR
jgi:hypothetical protein